jgi:hypothetical protein
MSSVTLCKICGFHGGDYEEWRLLGCYTVWLFKEPTFRRNLAASKSASVASYGYVPSSQILVTLMMEALNSSETSVPEPEGSLPSSQELSTCTFPEPNQSSPQHSLLSLKGPS